MIRFSRVSLLIGCDASEVAAITAHLGVEPSEVAEHLSMARHGDDTFAEKVWHNWVLHSPMSAEQGNPTDRLFALVELIHPFRDRIVSLDSRWHRWVDVLYHVTPQHPHGVTGEFDWFNLPTTLIKAIADLNLSVSYETFWFDHPEWQRPRRSWWARLRRQAQKP